MVKKARINKRYLSYKILNLIKIRTNVFNSPKSVILLVEKTDGVTLEDDKVIEILARELQVDIEDIQKDYIGSKTVIGKVKELRGEAVEI